MSVHPIAEKGFAGSVEAYRRSRPSYPTEAVAWLVEALGIARGRTVVDVGAGTGKFTALLVATGARLVAVEPIEQMRLGFAAELPDIEVVAGTAESIPMASGSADAIVVAQAFHWFDRSRALPEFARVLRGDGRLGVIWNDIDTSVEWAARFYAIVSPGRVTTSVPWSAAEGDLRPWFGPRRAASFRHMHALDRASLIGRVESMSWIAVLPDAERADMLRRVGDFVDRDPDLAGNTTFGLPYVTQAFWVERAK